ASAWNSSPPDVMSVASPGDLVVVQTACDDGIAVLSAPYTQLDADQDSNLGVYLGYRFIQAGDSNPTLATVGFQTNIAAVFAVFRNAISFSGTNGTPIESKSLDPPSLTAYGRLWLANAGWRFGDLDSIPAGYTIADSANSSGFWAVVAYRIAEITSDNPGSFTTDPSAAEGYAATTAFT
ncbi:MAG: hypothetical protein R3204_16635, partial [Oceanospirillum sp.]|nr:hypothetical protein [Oceanospirillum sp.]